MSNTKATSVETPTTDTEKPALTAVPQQGNGKNDDNVEPIEGVIEDNRTTSEKIKAALNNKKFIAGLVGLVAGGSLLYIIKQRNAAENIEDETSSN